MGVGGVTVISGGNLVTDDGMNSFGMLGRARGFRRLLSALLGWGPTDCRSVASSVLEPGAKARGEKAQRQQWSPVERGLSGA